MNLKQGRAQRHEMRTREGTVRSRWGEGGIVASTLLAAVVMVKSDMVLGVDRDNEREGSGGGRRLMQHEGTVHVPRDAGSRALSFTEACALANSPDADTRMAREILIENVSNDTGLPFFDFRHSASCAHASLAHLPNPSSCLHDGMTVDTTEDFTGSRGAGGVRCFNKRRTGKFSEPTQGGSLVEGKIVQPVLISLIEEGMPKDVTFKIK
ncbi:hypothetical protein BJV77DRAFT_1077598 [Russula vinacea]|nr:hypothetical protein BJV77DRAFT_1077598 [Russula vinacea]